MARTEKERLELAYRIGYTSGKKETP